MIVSKYFILVCSVVFFFAACKKDTDVFVPDEGQQLDSAWVSTITPNSQVALLTSNIAGTFDNVQFQVYAYTDTFFASNTGFTVEVPRESLLSNGSAYAGTVRAEYKLILRKGDFIRYGIPAISNRFPLECGGAFLVKLFTPSGSELTVNPSKRINIRYIDEFPKPNMSLYQSSVAPSVFSPFNWIKDANSQVTIWSSGTVPTQKGYAVSTTRTGWLSVQKLLEQTPVTDVNVVLPNLFSNANTAVFMVFKSIRSVVQLSGNPANRTFSFQNIPVNSEVKFVTISKVGDSYYLGVKDDKIISNYGAFVRPEISSLEKIQQFLNTL